MSFQSGIGCLLLQPEPASRGLITYGNTFVLHPLNPKYQDMEVKKGEFQIIGKVVKKEKRY